MLGLPRDRRVAARIGRCAAVELAGRRRCDQRARVGAKGDIDGEPVADGRMTMQKIGRLRPGDAIAITIQREQQSMDLKAIIGTLSQSAAVRESNVRERDQ